MTYKLLNGVHVIESSAFIAAPLGGLTLAQYGADVIRVEMIGGGIDYLRWPVAPSGRSLYWTGLNKGKRSIAIDLRKPQGRELVAALATSPQIRHAADQCRSAMAHACESDGQARRHDHLHHRGQSGRNDRGRLHGQQRHRLSVRHRRGRRRRAGQSCAAGLGHRLRNAGRVRRARRATCAAWRRARAPRSGISLADVAFSTLSHLGVLADAELFNQERPAIGNYIYGSFGRDFACADGERVMVAAISSRQWQSLVEACECAEALAAVEQDMGLALSVEADRYAAREDDRRGRRRMDRRAQA